MQTISRKTLLIGITSIVVIAALTIGALMFLRGNTDTSDAESAKTAAQPNAADILVAFNAKAADATYISGGVLTAIDAKQTQPLYVKDSELDKYVQVTTSNLAIITKAEIFKEDEVTNIIDNAKSFFTGQNLVLSDKTATQTVLVEATSDKTICQLVTLTTAAPYIELRVLCIDKSAYATDLSTTRELIRLWPAAGTTTYDLIGKDTTTKDALTVTIVTASKSDLSDAHTLVFVKSADAWTYIGDASTGTAVETNERFVINMDIKKGLDNPTYGAFLRTVLF